MKLPHRVVVDAARVGSGEDGLVVLGGVALSSSAARGLPGGCAVLTDLAERALLARAVGVVRGGGGRIALRLTGGQGAVADADFARGAAVTRELGFDAVEVAGVSGAGVAVAVLEAVRGAVGPDFPVLFRLTDLAPEVLAGVAVSLSREGADALGTSALGAPALKQALRAARLGSVPVICAFPARHLAQAEVLLAKGDVDFVAVPRDR